MSFNYFNVMHNNLRRIMNVFILIGHKIKIMALISPWIFYFAGSVKLF